MARSDPVSQIVRFLLTEALRDGAAEVRIEPLADRMRVRFRIDGALRDVMRLPLEMAAPVASRIRSLAGMGPREPHGRIEMRNVPGAVAFDLGVVRTVWGDKIVLRALGRGGAAPDLDDLGIEAGTLERWRALLRSPYGLLLVAGMPDMGKTTTLYASLVELSASAGDVTALDDHFAYAAGDVGQVDIGRTPRVSLATQLRRVLEQRPDAILVGEIGSKEVAEIVANAALTCRALSSVRAPDALAAIYRLRSFGVDPHLVTGSVVAVLAQLLVPRLCPHCRKAVQPAMIDAALLGQAGLPAERVYVADGCGRCGGTGRRGRAAAFELLVPSAEMRTAIQLGATVEQAREIAARAGIVTLRDAGLRLVSEGVTTMRDLLERVPVAASGQGEKEQRTLRE